LPKDRDFVPKFWHDSYWIFATYYFTNSLKQQLLLQVLGNFITFGAAVFVIIEADTIDPSQVGLIITYALSVTQVLNWLVRMTADVETNIVAVERIKVIIFVISRGCIKKK
jgi:ABC-type multidrug transport system fused ATPase/permease subunit